MLFRSQLNPDPALWAFAAAIVIPAILSHSARADEEHGLARFGLQMGDASYLLYLAHPVIMMVIGPISMRLHLPTQGTGVIMFVSSIIGALIGHQIFEKRLLKWTAPIFRKRPKAHH